MPPVHQVDIDICFSHNSIFHILQPHVLQPPAFDECIADQNVIDTKCVNGRQSDIEVVDDLVVHSETFGLESSSNSEFQDLRRV